MIIDCHVHTGGYESAREILAAMDAAGLNKVVLISHQPESSNPGWPRISTREALDHTAAVAREAPDRLIPFAWIEPTLPEALTELDRAVNELNYKGVKMIPNHWYPCDEAIYPLYDKVQKLGVPILFHSGILFANGDSSRFCRPAYYEALINFPALRFALAHISWPWVDECLAVYGRFRSYARHTGAPIQMWIDTCPGTPALWRPEALQKTLAYCGDEHLLWGSDSDTANLGRHAPEVLASDRRILRGQLGGNQATEKRWLGENALAFLGL
jgi:hypothetical protein